MDKYEREECVWGNGGFWYVSKFEFSFSVESLNFLFNNG